MVANLHETKFKRTKNNSVNQKKLLRGNLHVNFQCEGQLKFFDVVGSFFLAHWIFDWHWKKILVSDFSQLFISTQVVHVYDPRHLEWASLSKIFIIPVVQWGYSTSTFWFFSNLRFFLKYWSGSILYIGRLCLASDKTLYIFFFTFHIDDSGMRKCEVQQRDGWKSTMNRPYPGLQVKSK